jgi:hypothetical protein
MREHGQVFTLDMFLALTLTALIISYSGLALEQVRGGADGYVQRYSLERIANDAADVLAKTLGVPKDWYKQAENLEILGFAEENEGEPIPGAVDIKKFAQFRRLLRKDNWEAPVNAQAVGAIKRLFGGSEKFMVKLLDENGDLLWLAYPRWDVENSGAENALEVAVVRRLMAIRYGSAIRKTTGRIVRLDVPVVSDNYLYFDVYAGEKEAYDWYIVVRGEREVGNPKVQIFVNKDTGNFDYQFVAAVDAPEQTYPNPDLPATHRVEHGGIENDPTIKNEDRFPNPYPGTNYLYLRFTAGTWNWLQVYVILLPQCGEWTEATTMIQPLPGIMEIKVWK